jgi:hypothetical protein
MNGQRFKLLALAFLAVASLGCAELKDAGRTIGHTTRDVTRDIGHASRDVAKDVGHGTRRVFASATEDEEEAEQ